MSDDDSRQVSTDNGGWPAYKRLVMRLVETCVADVRDIFVRVTRLESDLNQLKKWVKDNDAKADKVRDRVSSAESDIRSIHDTLRSVDERLGAHRDATNRVIRERTPSPGLLVELWRHPLGKILLSLMTLAAVLGAAAAYNAVSIAQVDINNHLPRGNP